MTLRASPNRDVLESVARQLHPILADIVFVGGQVAELLITEPAAIRVRPTIDVDIVAPIASRAAYHRMESTLVKLGFRQRPVVRTGRRPGDRDPHGPAVYCVEARSL